MFSTLAEGSRLDLNFVCSIAPCNLMRELQAYKGGFPSPRIYPPVRSASRPAEAVHAFGLCAKQFCTSALSGTRHSAQRWLRPLAAEIGREIGAESAHTGGARGGIWTGSEGDTPPPRRPAAASRAGRYQRPTIPSFWPPKSSLRRRCRAAVNPRREEAKIAA